MLHYIVVTVVIDRRKCSKVKSLDREQFQAGNWACYCLDGKQKKLELIKMYGNDSFNNACVFVCVYKAILKITYY